MAGRFRRKNSSAPAELDVTTFMNLMVVLVPFLLLSAVFSEITIHDLNLPAISDGGGGDADRNKMVLEVVIKKDSLDLLNRNAGRIVFYPNKGEQHDFAALHQKLREIKSANPGVSNVTLLLDPEVKYNILVSTMDAVRSFDETVAGKVTKRDLFPDVSIGDAPRGAAAGDGS